MFLYMLIFMAYHSSRWIPRKQRVKFQIVNAVFVALVLVPQFYVMGRPKSSRYCGQPLLNNLAASIALSFIASGLSVLFTLMDPVPQSLWACCHVFGLLTCGQGLCTAVLTLTAAACARTTPELYYASLSLTAASIFSTGEVQRFSNDRTTGALDFPPFEKEPHLRLCLCLFRVLRGASRSPVDRRAARGDGSSERQSGPAVTQRHRILHLLRFYAVSTAPANGNFKPREK
ncbi:uncharacterized protein LOC119230053 isoform X1 [Pungitius pungitius]|uniref:uncharacterized protein LOC119230053 isoform X1 n=1 Tax=Pungitius pungitius TaxID=134920 RepID=UPI002E125F96